MIPKGLPHYSYLKIVIVFRKRRSHFIKKWLLLYDLKTLSYSFGLGANSKLNISLSGTSKARAILNMVLTVGFILTVSILAI